MPIVKLFNNYCNCAKSLYYSKLFVSSVNMGVAFFQIGYALFALSFLAINTSFATLVAGVFIYSIGEVITIPQLDIQIDRFAPNELMILFIRSPRMIRYVVPRFPLSLLCVPFLVISALYSF